MVRPDEDLLQSVRTDIIQGSGDSIEFIYELIESGEDVNQRSETGFTPLAVAAAAGSAGMVSLLLEKRADVRLASIERSELPLHHAAALGHDVVCQLLLEKTTAEGMLDAVTSAGWTALHLAVAGRHERTVQSLLKGKALTDIGNSVYGGHTALHLAASGGNVEMLELLLDYDAQVDAIDALRRTPLHLTAMCADSGCIAVLLRCRANPLQRGGPQDNTALEVVPRHAETSTAACALLSAYERNAPVPLRTDARFDLPGGNDILSAYSGKEISWGLQKSPVGITDQPRVTEWHSQDSPRTDIWL